ncbi:MAG: tRNA (5-methylaminomethyl-2-thiouridine)(34)-methyltransferase MnmD [Bacteroidia bacterium]|nr:tRNA (5-methylaminomethyl-2-thiouridine)(34)-methyltransferase MnmD [Bacteroidia bacterium]
MDSPSTPLAVVPTADGSPTLYHPGLRTHYHSQAGAAAESRHVFLQHTGLADLLATLPEVHVLEVGLGTGLNALLTAELARQYPSCRVHYHAVEPLPPPPAVLADYYRHLAAPAGWAEALYRQPNAPQLLAGLRFTWWACRWEAAPAAPGWAHALYYDPFDPAVAPELWTEAALLQAYHALAPGGRLATYSVRGETRRLLRRHGIAHSRPRGFGPKREMLVVVRAA